MIRVDECVFCGRGEFAVSVGLTAPFIAEYVLDQPPRPTEFCRCRACGGLFARERYEADEASRLYDSYRGARYLEIRHRHEFWYTARVNDGFGDAMLARRLAIRDALARGGVSLTFERGLDFGGGDGSLFPDGPWIERLVVDPSAEPRADGVTSAHGLEDVARSDFDLVMACQVLEHLADPHAAIRQLGDRLSSAGVVYLEVPDEGFADWTLPHALQQSYLGWLVRRPRLVTGFDLLSVAMRRKIGVVPPFGFMKLHEHINFFSLDALGKLVERSGLQPLLLRHHTVVTPSERLRIFQCVARRPLAK